MKKQWLAQCVRCGVHLRDNANKLWCDKCRERVNEEFRGEVSRPYEYYFRHHLKQMRKERDLFWQVWEFGS